MLIEAFAMWWKGRSLQVKARLCTATARCPEVIKVKGNGFSGTINCP